MPGARDIEIELPIDLTTNDRYKQTYYSKVIEFSYYNEEFSREETAQPQILARPDTNFLF